MKKTMKQHSFTTRLKSLAVVFGIAMVFASCANEDVAQNPTNPNEDNDKNLTTFVAGGENKTRTSMNYTSGDFYWEADDYIYVKDDNGVLQKSTNAPDQKVASFNYKVPGRFTASSSYKVYYLGKNSSGNSVTISTNQTQTVPNNTAHFGAVGDYGTATATKVTGKNQFEFVLEHHPAYLVFQPYTSNAILQSCKLTKVEVTSDNDIAETYTINPTTGALDASAVSNGKQIVLTTKGATSGSSYNNGFPLTNNSASVTTNGAYMVIKPGTHKLRIRYWVKDVANNIEGTITKVLSSFNYVKNTYYDMTADLNIRSYDGHQYYMWDAQQNYWAGHEWDSSDPWQPKLWYQSNPNYPQNNTDPRWHNEVVCDPSNPQDATTPLFQTLLSANEMSWYTRAGDPRWDTDELWATMGHLYKGGVWLKKLSRIAADQHVTTAYMKTKAVDGVDMRTHTIVIMTTPYFTIPKQTLPDAAEQADYFYLPALGSYNNGAFQACGRNGYYWSSTAAPTGGNGNAWLMSISKDYLDMHDFGSDRRDGIIAAPFKNGQTGSGPFFE